MKSFEVEKIEYPGQRHELMGYIGELSNKGLQEKEWKGKPGEHLFWYSMIFAYNFIINDLCFLNPCAKDPQFYIESILYNAEEYDAEESSCNYGVIL